MACLFIIFGVCLRVNFCKLLKSDANVDAKKFYLFSSENIRMFESFLGTFCTLLLTFVLTLDKTRHNMSIFPHLLFFALHHTKWIVITFIMIPFQAFFMAVLFCICFICVKSNLCLKFILIDDVKTKKPNWFVDRQIPL